jgi:hypothetical protein
MVLAVPLLSRRLRWCWPFSFHAGLGGGIGVDGLEGVGCSLAQRRVIGIEKLHHSWNSRLRIRPKPRKAGQRPTLLGHIC